MLLSPVVDDFKIVRLCVFASSKPCRISLISPKPHSNDTDFLQGGSSIVNQSGHDDRGKMRDVLPYSAALGSSGAGSAGFSASVEAAGASAAAAFDAAGAASASDEVQSV